MANAKTSGGVMLGASVWGYVKVDLGLFYGDMGATAGFDVSIRHLKGNNKCMNLKRSKVSMVGMARDNSMPTSMPNLD